MQTVWRYRPPFHVKEGIIYDAENRTVKLWGVNYYVPFNHNFFNIKELGLDHRKIIDEDLRHFQILGIDLIRMHLYEREITDRLGNIVENENLEILDYLIEECSKKGIYLMLSPTVWWNTVANQIRQEELYAYWHIGAQEAFGFTNFFSCDAMLWDQDAIDCQARYLRGLFSRKSTVSGKRMNEYSNIIVFELFNEPRYPEKWQLEKDLELTPEWMSAATYSRGAERKKLVRLWEEFRDAHPEEPDFDRCFSKFRAHILNHYFESLWPIITDFFGDNVIRAQFISYSGLPDEDLRPVFEKAPIEAATIGTYLNASGLFDAVNTDSANHLELATRWFDRFKKAPQSRLARISYEFDATGSTTGYPLAAIAAMYAQTGIQMASYFTYTPSGIAPWNPGWLVHFLNMEHTPARAASFAAAGEIFRSNEKECAVECGPEEWNGKNFKIRRENDLVIFRSPECFIHSGNCDEVLDNPSALNKILGRGKSRYAESSGSGCYVLRKLSDTEWELELFPDHKFLMDPTRGRTYRSMANRYVNCLKEPPVSRTMDRMVDFSFTLHPIQNCRRIDGETIRVDGGTIRIFPGRYRLTVNKTPSVQKSEQCR